MGRFAKVVPIILLAVSVIFIVALVIICWPTLNKPPLGYQPHKLQNIQSTAAPTTITDLPTTTVAVTTPKLTTTTVATTTSDLPTTTVAVTTPKLTTTTTVAITTTEKPPVKICETEKCQDVAAKMLDMMDNGRDIDPCEDFHQYVCGGVIDNLFMKPEDAQLLADNTIKEALAKEDRSDENLKDLLVFYDSCLNYQEIEIEDLPQKARIAFEKIAGEIRPKSKTAEFDLTKVLAKLMKMNFKPFFDISLAVERNDPEYFALTLSLPSSKSPFSQGLAKIVCDRKQKKKAEKVRLSGRPIDVTQHYMEYVDCLRKDGIEARIKNIKRAASALNVIFNNTDITVNDYLITEVTARLHSMLSNISESLPSPAEIRKRVFRKEYEIHSLKQLDEGEVFPHSPIKFQDFLRELLGVSLTNRATINVFFKDAFANMFQVLQQGTEDPSMMQNMLTLLLAEQVFEDLVKPQGYILGSKEYCSSAIRELTDDYTSFLYLKNLRHQDYLNDTIASKIESYVKDMKNKFETYLLQGNGDIKQKLSTLTGRVTRTTDVSDFLKNHKLKVNENDFVKNYINLGIRYRERVTDQFHLNSNSAEALWSVILSPYKAEAMFLDGLNKILIPHAVLESPLYEGDDVPAYINSAGLGHLIAGELMHALDKTSMDYSVGYKTCMQNQSLLLEITEHLNEHLRRSYNMINSTGFRSLFSLQQDHCLDKLLNTSIATNLAWYASITVDHITGNPDFEEQEQLMESTERLPHLMELSPLKMYYIKLAQNQCGASSEIDVVNLMESEHLPPKLRVNMKLQKDPLFAKAFNCSSLPTPQ